MVKCSQMGIATNDEVTIKNSSGRDQTKAAYLRILKTDEIVTGFRLIIEDLNAGGNPINYYPAPVNPKNTETDDSMTSFTPTAE